MISATLEMLVEQSRALMGHPARSPPPTPLPAGLPPPPASIKIVAFYDGDEFHHRNVFI